MRVIVGISGGIAAYKVPMLVRLLKKNGHEVQCVATSHALQFVTRHTLETLSGRGLYCDLFDVTNVHETEHIAIKDWGEMMIIAPATANIIGKMACGIADDALSTLAMAFSGKPMYICPSMNTEMLNARSTQRNLETLRRDGVNIIASSVGELACGAVGDGRMAEPEEIYKVAMRTMEQPLKGKKILVTAGPTYEKIDSVRFIGNYSSGKMGFAIAKALSRRGAEVVLVSGPTSLAVNSTRIECIRVESGREMYSAATTSYQECDGAIMTAAVADYRPKEKADHKIKKDGESGLTLELVQNPDILATLGQMKREDQFLIGFALETNDEEVNAKKKLEKKNLDMIVLNSLNDKGAGFGVDTNKVTMIFRDGRVEKGEVKSKNEVAEDIVRVVEEMVR